jgi:DNA gyrase subunit B
MLFPWFGDEQQSRINDDSIRAFTEALNDRGKQAPVYEVSIIQNGSTGLRIKRSWHGVDSDMVLDEGFWNSAEYREILSLSEKMERIIGKDGALVKRGETEEKVDNFADALKWLIAAAKKGLNLQRYKGLGEMNPEQLWETTMDPAVRRLLKIVVEDDLVTGETFSMLMGDQVEPRRNFIEDNAFSVGNLDV